MITKHLYVDKTSQSKDLLFCSLGSIFGAYAFHENSDSRPVKNGFPPVLPGIKDMIMLPEVGALIRRMRKGLYLESSHGLINTPKVSQSLGRTGKCTKK